MARKLITTVAVVLFSAVIIAKELPDFVKPCSRKDPKFIECAMQVIQDIKPKLIEGIPEMGVPSIDPLVVPYLLFDTGEGTNFAFVANITELNIEGSKDLKVVKADVDFDKDTFELNLNIPALYLHGHYTAQGRVLVVSFNGDGAMVLNATEVEMKGKMFGTRVTKKGKEHYAFNKHEMTIDIHGKISVNFENLFKGNPQLTESTNKMINDNADILYDELKPLVSSAFSGIVVNIFNEVHNRFPIEVLYPN